MRDWNGRRVVVTGGLGFIGSQLAIRLVSAGAVTTVVDLPDPDCMGRLENLSAISGRVSILREDLGRSGSWVDAVATSDVVFHLAAQVSHSGSMADPALDLSQNCGSLLGVLETARRVSAPPQVVFTSTRQVYGRAERLPVDEAHPVQPPDVNGIHKLAAENYLRLYREVYGVPTTALRLVNTYGPGMDLDHGGRGVLNTLIARALRGEPLLIYGDGAQRRDLNFVDDVVEALLLAADVMHPGPLNLGSDVPTSLNEFVEELTRLVPVPVQRVAFPREAAVIDVGDSHCDSRRFRELTGWQPRTSLREGLARTIEYFQPSPLLHQQAEVLAG